MTPILILPLGTPGLVKADLGLRYYADGVLDTTGVVAALVVTEVGAAGDYVIPLPEVADGTLRQLTYEYPAGVGGTYIYPERPPTPPASFVIAARETGLVAADFDLALYKDGVLRGDTLTTAEVGPTGEYRVSGWPVTTAGSWALVWRRNGLSFSYTWSSSGVTSGYHAEANALRDRLIATWTTTPIDFGAFGGRKYDPATAPSTPWVRCGITGFRAFQHALRTDAGAGWRHPGDFWVQVFVPDAADDCAQKAEQYADTIAGLFRAQTFGGVSCEDASVVRVGSANGWFQVNVLVRFRRDERF